MPEPDLGKSPAINNTKSFRAKDDLVKALEKGGDKNLFFPNNIEEIDHWVAFRVNKPVLMKKDDFPVKNDIIRIFLPLPASMGTQYSHTYNAEGIGLAGKAGADLGAAGASGGIDSIINKVSQVKKEDIANASLYFGLQLAEQNIGTAVGGNVGGLTGLLAGASAEQALKGAVAGAGIARNPYMAVMYDSPQFRAHTFSWKFIARDKTESVAIRNIIRAFKYHAAPGLSNNPHFITYPEQFDIDFHYPNFLYNIGPSVMESMDVAYHAEGTPLYFDFEDDSGIPDKAPVSITISATFKEVSVLSKETIDKENR